MAAEFQVLSAPAWTLVPKAVNCPFPRSEGTAYQNQWWQKFTTQKIPRVSEAGEPQRMAADTVKGV